MTVDLQLLVIPCKNVYKYILGSPFTIMMDVVASLKHLKLKYHNIHEESVMMCADLFKAQIIRQP